MLLFCVCDYLPVRGCTSLMHQAADFQFLHVKENSQLLHQTLFKLSPDPLYNNGAEQQVPSKIKGVYKQLLQGHYWVILGHRRRCRKKPQTCSNLTRLKIDLR